MRPEIAVNIVNIIALMCLMLGIGLQVKLEDIGAALKDRWMVAFGVLANYIAVPLATILLLAVVHPSPEVAAGFLVLAVCPGAPVAPTLTELARGRVSLAVGLMLVLAGSSALMAPLLLTFLFSRLFPESPVSINYLAIAQTLLMAQVLPLVAGLGFKKFLPQVADKISAPTNKVAKVLFLIVIVMIGILNYKAFAMVRPAGWGGMAVLLLLSLTIGWVCGGREEASRRASALTTATRNAGVGLVIVLNNFAGTPAVAAVVVYSVTAIFACLALSKWWGKHIPEQAANCEPCLVK